MDDDRALYLKWLTTRDEAAFTSLARRHSDLVADVAWRSTGDWARAEDALQEALLALAHVGTERPGEVGVRAWLAREALSHARHALASDRARGRRERAVGASRAEAAMHHGENPAATEIVRAALDRLDGDERVAIVLRYVHGIEYSEIAAILDVAEPTARVRVHRALERLRAEAGRPDLDERGIASVLLALPRATVPAVRLESAVAAALAAAASTAPAVAATTAAAGMAAWLRWGVAAVVLAAAAGTYFATRAARDGAAGRDSASTARSGEQANSPSLARRPPSSPRASSATVPPGGDVAPPTASPTPAPRPSDPRREATVPVRLRMDLVKADGSTEEIAISETYFIGVGRRVDADHPAAIDARPGYGVTVRTEDARAAFPGLFARVPDPAPGVVVLRMPSADHPRLASLILEFVDAGTGAPVPGARIEWEPDSPVQSPSTGDATGRAALTMPGSKVDRTDLFWGLAGSLVCVHASGYLTYGGWRAFNESHKELVAPAIDATAAERWLETGTYRIRLQRELESGSTPSPQEWASVERSVRFVDGADRPLVGAYVAVLRHLTPKAMENVRILGASVTASDITQGFRRTDADGVISAPMANLMALELRIDGVPFAAWGVAAEGWPESGPRILRVPDACDLEIAVEGVPQGAAASWGLDTLGAARSLPDGPCEGRYVAYDPAVARDVAAGGMSPAWLFDARGGVLDAANPTVRLRLAVGNPCRILVTMQGSSAAQDNGTRVIEVRPDRGGSVRLVRRWDELPVLTTGPRDEGTPAHSPHERVPGK